MNIQPRGRILLVDDDEDVSNGIRDMLEIRYHFYVRVARSNQEALREIVQDQFDVIVLDWILRDGDGREVVRFIRTISPDTQVVVYSANPGSDSECTAANVNEFVEKSHETLPLRNAVERAVASAQAARLRNVENPGEPDWFAETLLEQVGCGADVGDQHVAVTCTAENICDDIAMTVARRVRSVPRSVMVLDLSDHVPDDAPKLQARLFGECTLSEGIPTLRRGILDHPKPISLIVRQPQNLTIDAQQMLAAAINLSRIRRVGSDRDLNLNCRLVLVVSTQEPKTTFSRFHRSLSDLVSGSVIRVPTLDQMPLGANASLRKLLNRRWGANVGVSPSVECALRISGRSPHWSSVRIAIEEIHNRRENRGLLEIEEAGLSLFESVLTNGVGTTPTLIPWKEVESKLKAAYVCRALSETGGNIVEASRITGLHRNVIYSMLKTFQIDRKQFRIPAQQILFQN